LAHAIGQVKIAMFRKRLHHLSQQGELALLMLLEEIVYTVARLTFVLEPFIGINTTGKLLLL
jgi:uncharacterized membrane protein YhaH (DUF805 family)